MKYITATKFGIDGTDVRLLKLLAKKFGFAYNITNPSSYYAAIKMVCNSDLSFLYNAIMQYVGTFSVEQPRGRFIPYKGNIQEWYFTS